MCAQTYIHTYLHNENDNYTDMLKNYTRNTHATRNAVQMNLYQET
jgi:hypothetical protein